MKNTYLRHNYILYVLTALAIHAVASFAWAVDEIPQPELGIPEATLANIERTKPSSLIKSAIRVAKQVPSSVAVGVGRAGVDFVPQSIAFYVGTMLNVQLQSWMDPAKNIMATQQLNESSVTLESNINFAAFSVGSHIASDLLLKNGVNPMWINTFGMTAGMLMSNATGDLMALANDPDIKTCGDHVRRLEEFEKRRADKSKAYAVSDQMLSSAKLNDQDVEACDKAYLNFALSDKAVEYSASLVNLLASTGASSLIFKGAGFAGKKFLATKIGTQIYAKWLLSTATWVATPEGRVGLKVASFTMKAGLQVLNFFGFMAIGDWTNKYLVHFPQAEFWKGHKAQQALSDVQDELRLKTMFGFIPLEKVDDNKAVLSRDKTCSEIYNYECKDEFLDHYRKLSLKLGAWRDFEMEEVKRAYQQWTQKRLGFMNLKYATDVVYSIFIDSLKHYRNEHQPQLWDLTYKLIFGEVATTGAAPDNMLWGGTLMSKGNNYPVAIKIVHNRQKGNLKDVAKKLRELMSPELNKRYNDLIRTSDGVFSALYNAHDMWKFAGYPIYSDVQFIRIPEWQLVKGTSGINSKWEYVPYPGSYSELIQYLESDDEQLNLLAIKRIQHIQNNGKDFYPSEVREVFEEVIRPLIGTVKFIPKRKLFFEQFRTKEYMQSMAGYKVPGHLASYHTDDVFDYLVVSSACGPIVDAPVLQNKRIVKGKAQLITDDEGHETEFTPPALTPYGDEVDTCNSSFLKSMVKGGRLSAEEIYTRPVTVSRPDYTKPLHIRGGGYEKQTLRFASLFDYVVLNIRPEFLQGDHHDINSAFGQYYTTTVAQQTKAAYHNLNLYYGSLVNKFVDYVRNSDTSIWGDMPEGALGEIRYELRAIHLPVLKTILNFLVQSGVDAKASEQMNATLAIIERDIMTLTNYFDSVGAYKGTRATGGAGGGSKGKGAVTVTQSSQCSDCYVVKSTIDDQKFDSTVQEITQSLDAINKAFGIDDAANAGANNGTGVSQNTAPSTGISSDPKLAYIQQVVKASNKGITGLLNELKDFKDIVDHADIEKMTNSEKGNEHSLKNDYKGGRLEGGMSPYVVPTK